MKKALLLVAAIAAFGAANAQDDVLNLTFEADGFHQSYFANGGDWYNTIHIGQDYEFYFDIFGPEEGLESGHVYTLDDMDVEYSWGIDYVLYTQIHYTSAQYQEVVAEDGSKVITATIVSTDGITYNLNGTWAPSDEPDMILMPEGLNTIDCVLTCTDMDYGEQTYESSLAFDGSDVYLEGSCYVSYFFQSAIKGTVDADGSLHFPMGQCVGFGSTTNYFIYGFSFDTFATQDITFAYDPALGSYTCTSDIAVTPGLCDQLTAYYEYIYDIVLTPSTPVAIERVETAAKPAARKMLIDGQLKIEANGRTYNAAGLSF